MLARIRAVFADAQTEGLDQLYDVINAARDLAPDVCFFMDPSNLQWPKNRSILE